MTTDIKKAYDCGYYSGRVGVVESGSDKAFLEIKTNDKSNLLKSWEAGNLKGRQEGYNEFYQLRFDF